MGNLQYLIIQKEKVNKTLFALDQQVKKKIIEQELQVDTVNDGLTLVYFCKTPEELNAMTGIIEDLGFPYKKQHDDKGIKWIP